MTWSMAKIHRLMTTSNKKATMAARTKKKVPSMRILFCGIGSGLEGRRHCHRQCLVKYIDDSRQSDAAEVSLAAAHCR